MSEAHMTPPAAGAGRHPRDPGVLGRREGRPLPDQRCVACKQAHWHPRAHCPFLRRRHGLGGEPREGEVYTFSIMRKSPTGPYALGYVTLDEGPAVLTNFVGMAPDDLKIGMRVKVRFQPTEGDGPPAPVFGPA